MPYIPEWDLTHSTINVTLTANDTVAVLRDKDQGDSAGIAVSRSMVTRNSGKWYCEITVLAMSTNTDNGIKIAVCNDTYDMHPGEETQPESVRYSPNIWCFDGFTGNKLHDGDDLSYGSQYDNLVNPIIGVALDLDTGRIYFALNGVWQASGDPVNGTGYAFIIPTGVDYYIAGTGCFDYFADATDTVKTGFSICDFSYTPPEGFLPLSDYRTDEVHWSSCDHTALVTLDGTASEATLPDVDPVEDFASIVKTGTSVSTGKLYCEIVRQSPANNTTLFAVGISTEDYYVAFRTVADGHRNELGFWWFEASGFAGSSDNVYEYGDEYDSLANVTIMLAIDLDNGEVHFGINSYWISFPDDIGSGVAVPVGNEYRVTAESINANSDDVVILHTLANEFSYPVPTGYSPYYFKESNDIAGNLPNILGTMYGNPIGRINQPIPAITGSIICSAKLAGSISYITGSLNTGAKIVSTDLPGIEGVLFSSSNTGNILGRLPKISGKIYQAGRMEGTLPGITGKVEEWDKLLGKLPAITGGINALAGTKGVISGRLAALAGDLLGHTDIAGRIDSGTLPYIQGSLSAYSGSVGNIDRFLPALRGALTGSILNTGSIAKGLPAVVGSMYGITGSIGNISGELGITGSMYAFGGLVGRIYGEIYLTGSMYGRQEIAEEIILSYQRRICG